MRREFCFDSIDSIAKNIHLFDEVFGIIRNNHNRNKQLSALSQLNFGGFAGGFNISVAQPQEETVERPASFKYFDVLNESNFLVIIY